MSIVVRVEIEHHVTTLTPVKNVVRIVLMRGWLGAKNAPTNIRLLLLYKRHAPRRP